MGKPEPTGAKPMPNVEKAAQSTLFKAPPRRLRMSHPPTPPPAPQRSPKKSEPKKS